MTDSTYYHFSSWYRQGLSVGISDVVQGNRALVDVTLPIEAHRTRGGQTTVPVNKSIELYGPGDVLGFDFVGRTDPLPDVGEFEPNYFPAITFLDADFPWRRTPRSVDEEGNLTPWITLIALVSEDVRYRDTDGQEKLKSREFRYDFEVENDPSLKERRVKWISVDAGSLPSISEAWRWAHVQVTGPELTGDRESAVQDLIRDDPDRAVSRLICARRLRTGVLYTAFVVPTFKSGLVAAGQAVALDTDTATTPAWQAEDGEISLPEIRLPYYHRWEFRTGQRGDFEHLVRLLEPRKLSGLGIRPINCAVPGYGLPPVIRADSLASDESALDLEGALKSFDTEFSQWGKDSIVTNVRVDANGAGATVQWRTVEPMASRVDYGLSAEYGSSVEMPSQVIDHSIELSNLLPGTIYHYRITSTNEERAARTRDLTFEAGIGLVVEDASEEFAERLATDLLNKADVLNVTSTASFPDIVPIVNLQLLVGDDYRTVRVTGRAAGTSRWRVEYGEADSTEFSQTEEMATDEDHSVSLPDLEPGATYVFRIVNTHAPFWSTGDSKFGVPSLVSNIGEHLLPTVLPPIYGRQQSGMGRVYTNSFSWSSVLNLDPRHRVAAGLGAEVVRKQQESLAASAWDQLGPIKVANEVLRRAQFGLHASLDLYGRIAALESKAMGFLQFTGPLHKRVRFSGDGTTAYQKLRDTPIPATAFDPAFRRIARPRGPIVKKQKADGEPNRKDVFVRLLNRTLRPAGPHPKPDGTIQLCDVTKSVPLDVDIDLPQDAGTGVSPSGPGRTFYKYTAANAPGLFCEPNITCDAVQQVVPLPRLALRDVFDWQAVEGTSVGPSDYTTEAVSEDQVVGAMSEDQIVAAAVCDVLDTWLGPTADSDGRGENVLAEDAGKWLDDVAGHVITALNPRDTIVARTRARLSRTDDDDVPASLDGLRGGIEFPQPMYEPLQEISQELLLPGIRTVPQNTLGLLETDRRFMESYMCGLSHEFSSEAIWREIPAYLGTTFFRQFWDVSGYIPSGNDQKALEDVARRELADELSSISDENEKQARIDEWVEARIEDELKDIRRIDTWASGKLGDNDNRGEEGFPGEISRIIRGTSGDESVVLIVRGDLLKKYPDAVVYAVRAREVTDSATDATRIQPDLDEFLDGSSTGLRTFPIFSAKLPPDITFFGFPFSENQALGNGRWDHGYYIVLEERVSEARFGMDVAGDVALTDDWGDLNWSHTDSTDDGVPCDTYLDGEHKPDSTGRSPKWDDGAAAIARITLQKPARIVVHANQMIP